MQKLGLKVWSTNQGYCAAAQDLCRRGVCDYVELYVVPDSAAAHAETWQRAALPFLLHVPHAHSGFNLSISDNEEANRRMLAEVDTFRTALGTSVAIAHPGILGSIEETVRQIQVFQREFPALMAGVLIENKPRVGLYDEMCMGSSPEEIRQVIEGTGQGFCFDVAHAMCYAAWAREPWEKVFDRFLELGPRVMHLSDGEVGATKDSHPHFGEGNFDLPRIARKIPQDVLLTIETRKDSQTDLRDFERDAEYLKGLL